MSGLSHQKSGGEITPSPEEKYGVSEQDIQALYGNAHAAQAQPQAQAPAVDSGQFHTASGTIEGRTASAEEGIPEEEAAQAGLFDWLFGEEEEEERQGGAVENAEHEGAPEHDPWWPDLQAVLARSDALSARRRDLELANPTEAGRIVDPDKEALAQDVLTFAQQCLWVRANWESLGESDRADWVMELEATADVLELEMSQHQGDIDAYDAKLAEKLAIIARVVQPMEQKVAMAEATLGLDKKKVEQLRDALDNQRLVTQVNLGLNLFSAALGLTPAGIIGTGMAILNMGISPSVSGGADIANAAVDVVGKGSEVVEKLTSGVGMLLGAYGTLSTAMEDRDKYYEIYAKLKAAMAKSEASANELARLMREFNAQLAMARQYASKATGV